MHRSRNAFTPLTFLPPFLCGGGGGGGGGGSLAIFCVLSELIYREGIPLSVFFLSTRGFGGGVGKGNRLAVNLERVPTALHTYYTLCGGRLKCFCWPSPPVLSFACLDAGESLIFENRFVLSSKYIPTLLFCCFQNWIHQRDDQLIFISEKQKV